MNKKLNIQWFIEQNRDWERILSEKPYAITISRDKMFGRNLIMFKYSQIDSNFNIGLVRECRGLILDEDTLEPVCVPFFKFGNYGESYCPEIDWKSCYVTEKLDGSLIKVVRLGDHLLFSTNGTIDAFKAPLAEQIGCASTSFGELALEGLKYYGLHTDNLLGMLKEGYTYMFELTSPFNKVVVTWHDTKLNFIGCRDNTTFQEMFFGEHELAKIFNIPKIFPLRSVSECVEAAKLLDCNAEGYVVVDKDFNRVKIKSPTYVSLHHMKNNGVLSYERGIEIVRGNELGEVLTYFPEFKLHLEKIQKDYNSYIENINNFEVQLRSWLKENGYIERYWLVASGGKDRGKAARWIMTTNKALSGFAFMILDNKVKNAKEFVDNLPSSKLVVALGYKE